MKIYDLTLPYSVDMSVFPGTPSMSYTLSHTVAKDHYNLGIAAINSHSGTHTDAPLHFIDGGASLADVPVERYVGMAVIADCSPKAAPFSEMTSEDLKPWEDKIRKHRKVILKNGWSNHAKEERFYTDYPVITEECAQYLVSLGVEMVGVEAPSLNPGKAAEVHTIFLEAGVAIVEALTNLDVLPSDEIFFSGAPLPLAGGDGFPIRAVAIDFE